jgi:hypothetical protein
MHRVSVTATSWVNAVYGNNCCLLWEPCGTHNHTSK